MPPSRASTPFGVGPYRAFLEVGGEDPTRFLSLFQGEPRGFWGQRDRWTAWGGALARIEVASGADSRFERVRRDARAILERTGWESPTPGSREAEPGDGDTAPPPRFFGGFSFLDDGAEGDAWSGFPPASFILPRFVLRGDGGQTRLYIAGEPAEIPARFRRLSAGEFATPRSNADGSGGEARSFPGSGASSPARSEVEGAGRERWTRAVEGVLDAIREGRVEKAVLARELDARFARAVDPLRALRFLLEEDGLAHVYLFEPKAGRAFLGAAPELLARLRGDGFEATAVAGSMPRAGDPVEDAALARRLLESPKDREEHRLTADDMVEVLGPHLTEMQVEATPRVLSLARIHHLETVLHGRVRGGTDILSLVEVLHPTPAVCGRPRGHALELIRAAEPFDRGWYSGPVGWFDAAGDGEFVPALRVALGGGRDWRLFAGAGIVAGSDPDAEWAETALKFEPALRALEAGACD